MPRRCEAKDMLLTALNGGDGPASDIVALNAGAAIYVAGLAEDHGGGVRIARDLLRSGAAARKLEEFIAYTRALSA